MNTQEEMSSISSPNPSTASIAKKVIKIVVLAHKSYVYDQLGGRTAATIQHEISSDRKKYQGYEQVKNDESFESMLERIRSQVRSIPSYRGLCTYLVESDGPTIVDNKADVLQYVMCSSETRTDH